MTGWQRRRVSTAPHNDEVFRTFDVDLDHVNAKLPRKNIVEPLDLDPQLLDLLVGIEACAAQTAARRVGQVAKKAELPRAVAERELAKGTKCSEAIGKISRARSDHLGGYSRHHRVGFHIFRHRRARRYRRALAEGDTREDNRAGPDEHPVADNNGRSHRAEVWGGEVVLQGQNNRLNRDAHVLADGQRETPIENHSTVDDCACPNADSRRASQYLASGSNPRAAGNLHSKNLIQAASQVAAGDMPDTLKGRVAQFGRENPCSPERSFK